MYTPIAPLKYFDKCFNLTLGGTWSTEMFLTNASTCWPRSAHINILSWCRAACGDPFRHFLNLQTLFSRSIALFTRAGSLVLND